MDELTLLLEGIQHKVKRLMVINERLRERISSLELERTNLLSELNTCRELNGKMEQEVLHLQAARSLGENDSLMAKQKVNELLREIDKCYKLIKSQAK